MLGVAGEATAAAAAAAPAGGASSSPEPQQRLSSFGFTNVEQNQAALDECGPDVDACVRWLMAQQQAGVTTTAERGEAMGAVTGPEAIPVAGLAEQFSPQATPLQPRVCVLCI